MSTDPLAHLAAQLDELDRAGLRRRPPVGLRERAAPSTQPPELNEEQATARAVSFCSNDYLGLASRAAPPAATGSGASRLIAGERDEHRRLETAFAQWLGTEDALAFSSGYAANVGAVSALAAPGDLIVSDALNHASLIDGARLSRARVAVVPHGDLSAVAHALETRTEQRAWVVVESYYSMDADGPDLAALRALCDARGAALVVDEAHALGVLGPAGRGRCAEAGVLPDVLVAPLGKAFGGQGALVAGRTVVREWLWNRARSFVFSTGLAPVSAAAAVRALAEVIERPERGLRVRAMADRLREGLLATAAVAGWTHGAQGAALETMSAEDRPRLIGFGHVVPLVVGAAERALRLAAALRIAGIEVQAIRPPTVPDGTARLRLTVTANHGPEDIDRAVIAFAAAVAAERTSGDDEAPDAAIVAERLVT